VGFTLVAAFIAFTLWLGAKILDKAGIHKGWVFCLLIPVVNIIMIWIFAYMDVGKGREQERKLCIYQLAKFKRRCVASVPYRLRHF
jgi:hypothetical protein